MLWQLLGRIIDDSQHEIESRRRGIPAAIRCVLADALAAVGRTANAFDSWESSHTEPVSVVVECTLHGTE